MKSTKRMLDEIVNFLNDSDERDSQNLWSILTALRGPDNQDPVLKDLYTARIRYAIGLRSQAQAGASLAGANHTQAGALLVCAPLIYPPKRLRLDSTDITLNHYNAHVCAALDALKALGHTVVYTREEVKNEDTNSN